MIALIVAYAHHRVIGKDGQMPWFIKEELAHFKDITMGSTLIMGSKTYEGIGHPLLGREIIVLSKSKDYCDQNVKTARSLEEALALASYPNVFIAGGASVYKEAIDLVDKMYITKIDLEVPGDRYFVDFDESQFIEIPKEKHIGDINYQYFEYIRK